MLRQGEIYFYTDARIPPHPVVVVSREELNRGDRVVAAIITSARFALRSTLSNRVPLLAGRFGLTKNCVVQGDSVFNAPIACTAVATGPIGALDDETMRQVVQAIGHVMDATCEPL